VAKYGLAQEDLNFLVQMSLAGLIDEPERHLADLLISQQPIEVRTRLALANALSGRLSGSTLKVRQPKQVSFVRKFRRARYQIDVGRRMSAKMNQDGLTYEDAVAALVETCGRSDKWVQACHTKANKLGRWIQECRKGGLNHSDEALEMAFVYSALKGLDPSDGLKPTVEQLAEFVTLFEQKIADASGILVRYTKSR